MTAVLTLDNCDREPIHVPGHIQSHGALLAFDARGVIAYASVNARDLLGNVPNPGETLQVEHLAGSGLVQSAIHEAFAQEDEGGSMPFLQDVVVNGNRMDLIVHRNGDLLVAEFEQRSDSVDDAGAFAAKAHRGVDRLRRQRTLQGLFEVAVTELRALTGFDRVMAYQFRHDGSGDVVAEARIDSLEPFLNRRYPASDIPAQARRLYVINTLRLIADVASAPVAVQGTTPVPLDMSHCVLRSVSPIHIEYLTNMGVGASMSVSIVVNGQLWGLLACHHMSARQVPYSVRMACDVLGQIMASNVQSIVASDHAKRIDAVSVLRTRVVESLLHGQEGIAALAPLAPELRAAFDAGASILCESGEVSVEGDISKESAKLLIDWLTTEYVAGNERVLAVSSLVGFSAPVAAALGAWCGVLALRFDEIHGSWLVLLRVEQQQTVDWGGKPEKVYTNGPLGPRLTPRGSFDVWREVVRGTAVPWSPSEREIALQLREELMRAANTRNAEIGRAREQLLAVLGHDLRDPLQSISMGAHLLAKGGDGVRVGARIQSSSTRMQRLISQVLDVSRLQSGFGLGFNLQPHDLAVLINDVADELMVAHPETRIDRDLPAQMQVAFDPDRMAQLLTNLLANARHHGKPDLPIVIKARMEGRTAIVEVINHGEPIAPDVERSMFNAFKREMTQNLRNRDGLGLGLYIAQEIARGHGGTLQYRYGDGQVIFALEFCPAAQPPAHL